MSLEYIYLGVVLVLKGTRVLEDSSEFIVKWQSVPVTSGTCSPLPRRTGPLSVCSSSSGSDGGVTNV